MPVRTTTQAELREHFLALGIETGDNLCVHSRVLSFGRLEGGASFVRDALLDSVGPSGTVAAPTFTFNLTPSDVYDAATTPPYLVGPLSESVWRHPNSVRTNCPVHSFAAIGPASAALMAADPSKPLGPGSAFEVMRREEFKMLLLGCNYQEGATYVHHVEAMVGVPYRMWVSFPRQVKAPGRRVTRLDVHYYGKKPDAPKPNRLEAVEMRVESAGLGSFVPLSYRARRSHIIALRNLDECVASLLSENPYVLVSGPDVS